MRQGPNFSGQVGEAQPSFDKAAAGLGELIVTDAFSPRVDEIGGVIDLTRGQASDDDDWDDDGRSRRPQVMAPNFPGFDTLL